MPQTLKPAKIKRLRLVNPNQPLYGT